MQILAERLKTLREGRRIYQKEMAELLGLSLRGYQCYETDESEPKLAALIALADFSSIHRLPCGPDGRAGFQYDQGRGLSL